MDHPNENMENFFRKSLDKFDEEPSGDVWAALDERLDEDRPLFIYKWLKFLFPIALLLIGFSALYYNQNQLLNDYKSHLSELTKENEILRQEKQLEAQSEKDLTSAIPSSTNIDAASPIQIVEKYVDRIRLIRDTVYLTKYLQRPLLGSETNSLTQATFQASKFSLQGLAQDHSSSNQFGKNSNLAQPRLSELAAIRFKDPTGYKIASSSVKAFDLPKMKYARAKADFSNRKKKKFTQLPIIVKNLDPWGQPGFYYKVGPTLKVTSTLKGDLFSPSSVGLSYGITQEIGLTSRFAFTAAAMRSFQEYRLSNNGLPLDNNTISSYPDWEMFDAQITSIEVENHLFEFPIGIKYDFYQDNLKSFFINPAVKWSILKPQDIRYGLIDNRLHNYDGNITYGYLNALSFSLGMEKSITPWISYQMSLAYEHGIEPIGVEKAYQNCLHFNINLLFGRK